MDLLIKGNTLSSYFLEYTGQSKTVKLNNEYTALATNIEDSSQFKEVTLYEFKVHPYATINSPTIGTIFIGDDFAEKVTSRSTFQIKYKIDLSSRVFTFWMRIRNLESKYYDSACDYFGIYFNDKAYSTSHYANYPFDNYWYYIYDKNCNRITTIPPNYKITFNSNNIHTVRLSTGSYWSYRQDEYGNYKNGYYDFCNTQFAYTANILIKNLKFDAYLTTLLDKKYVRHKKTSTTAKTSDNESVTISPNRIDDEISFYHTPANDKVAISDYNFYYHQNDFSDIPLIYIFTKEECPATIIETIQHAYTTSISTENTKYDTLEKDTLQAHKYYFLTKQIILEGLYPVGSIYINKSASTNPATLLGFGTWERVTGRFLIDTNKGTTQKGGQWYEWIQSENLPTHLHKFTYTPKGINEETNTDHIHSILHTHDINHTHTTKAHMHSYTPEGSITSNDWDDGRMDMVHTANFFQTVSDVDNKLFTKEDFNTMSYSTGEKNTWTDRKPMQRIKLAISNLVGRLQFVGKKKNTEKTTVELKDIKKYHDGTVQDVPEDTNLTIDVESKTVTYTDGTEGTETDVKSVKTTKEGMDTTISDQVNTDETLGLKNTNAVSHTHTFVGTTETLNTTTNYGYNNTTTGNSSISTSISYGPQGVESTVLGTSLTTQNKEPLDITPPWLKVYIWTRIS